MPRRLCGEAGYGPNLRRQRKPSGRTTSLRKNIRLLRRRNYRAKHRRLRFNRFGSGGGTRTELVHIAQPDKLRFNVNVPEAYSQAAKPGLTAQFGAFGISRPAFSGNADQNRQCYRQSTRTLLVEIRVNNPTGTLFSGAYAEVHLKLPSAATAFILPVNALLFRAEGLRVVSVNDKSSHRTIKSITLGGSTSALEVEVVAGYRNESIVVNRRIRS